MFTKPRTAATLLCAMLFAGVGCVDLDVTNTQQPDRARALSNPSDVESLIAGTFGVFYVGVHDTWQISHNFANVAEMNTTSPWWATVPQSREPRPLFDNSPDIPNFTGPHGPRTLWAELNEVLSSAHDGLRAIRESGTRFTEAGQDVTPRGEAFAKFMQGTAWGYHSMLFDEAIVIPEDVPLSDDVATQVRGALTPYQETRDAAVAALDEAIQIAQANSFTFPSAETDRRWFATLTPMGSAEFARLANTMAARILVLNARSPAEREQVDWNRVLQYTANGVTSDFGTVLAGASIRDSFYFGAAQGVAGTAFCCYRLDYRLVGPADISGNYQEWISAPVEERTPFLITTPDGRITGGSPSSNGSYVRFRATHTGFNQTDGLYRFSHYQWGRHAIRNNAGTTATANGVGIAWMVTVDENRLLRAEALLRTGNLQGAADLINVTRTRNQTLQNGTVIPGLPPVTAAGVPQSPNCVPRTDAGACGDLMTALMYERRIELIGLDAVRSYPEARGFGVLPSGTFIHQPVPGNELDLLGMPIYSYGGPGGEGAAVYDPAGGP
jgi:hypothetical protein